MVSEEVKQPSLFIHFHLVMTSCDGKITTSSVIMKFSHIYNDIIRTTTALKSAIILPIYSTIASIVLAITAFRRKYLVDAKQTRIYTISPYVLCLKNTKL